MIRIALISVCVSAPAALGAFAYPDGSSQGWAILLDKNGTVFSDNQVSPLPASFAPPSGAINDTILTPGGAVQWRASVGAGYSSFLGPQSLSVSGAVNGLLTYAGGATDVQRYDLGATSTAAPVLATVVGTGLYNVRMKVMGGPWDDSPNCFVTLRGAFLNNPLHLVVPSTGGGLEVFIPDVEFLDGDTLQIIGFARGALSGSPTGGAFDAAFGESWSIQIDPVPAPGALGLVVVMPLAFRRRRA